MVLSFIIVLIFVFVLGTVSFLQSNQLFQQAETMYNHPMKVTSAIGELNVDILNMRVGLRDFIIAQSDADRQIAKQLIESSDVDALRQFEVLEDLYLGPGSDVDVAIQSYFSWKNAVYDNLELALAGEVLQAEKSIGSSGTIWGLKNELAANVQKIEDFANNKANELYTNYITLHDALRWQLTILIAVILLLTFVIYFGLVRTIRKPLTELTNVTRRFHQGDTNARISYESKNEFGVLAASFNAMVDTIVTNMKMSKKAANISGVMLSVDDANQFFRSTLTALADQTGSQMAAVYLLTDDQKRFEHFESIGLDDKARRSFDAHNLEGEFGLAISTNKRQYIKNIPEDTHFTFHTAGGRFIPREIITIPILSGDRIISVITLASISRFSENSIELIDTIIDTMSARIAGILAYRTIKEFKDVLEKQNRELDTQKNELSAQTFELTQQNTELETQAHQLAEASRLKTNFLSNMSHELRTPLNSVIALSGVLKRRLTSVIPAEEHGYLEVIERNGKDLLALINDILDISLIEAGREKTEISKFDLSRVIADMVSVIQPQAKQKDIELKFDAGGQEVFVTSDADKLRHILQNIIGNAVKFTEEGKVDISFCQNGDRVNIVVADTGIGIDEESLPYIFEEFRQADGGMSRRFGGTGLGLAIAKKYVKMLGGTIGISSKPGAGSIFTVSLPLHYGDENMNTETEEIVQYKNTTGQKFAQPQPEINAANKTILLVEDSEPAIIQIKDLLEDTGYRILIARNGVEAYKIIGHTTPDAMILDLMMPDIDGFEVLRKIRETESTSHLPVLILTAKHITKEELNFLKSNHVHQLIQKGDVNRIELLNAVMSMLLPETAEAKKPQRGVKTDAGVKPVVLVVEDNLDNLTTAKALLSGCYSVIEATDGNQAVEMAKKHKPNLVLMDISLPGIDGIEAFKIIRNYSSTQHIPVIALTASAMIQDREIILSKGFDAFISKPIIEKTFFDVINEVLYGDKTN